MLKMLRSFGFGLGLETFDNFLGLLVLENLVSEISIGKMSQFQKIRYQRKNYRYQFRSKFWCRRSVIVANVLTQLMIFVALTSAWNGAQCTRDKEQDIEQT